MLHLLSVVTIIEIPIVFRLFNRSVTIGSSIFTTSLFHWRVCILIESGKELVSDLTLRLIDSLKSAALAISHFEDALPRLTDHHTNIDHAFVCILNLVVSSLDYSVIARVVHHDKVVAFFNHNSLPSLLLINYYFNQF